MGLNGLDFVARDGVPYPIEVNPRYSASMELVERATARSLFAIHARRLRGPAARRAARRPVRVHGKAIVFARRDVVVERSARLARRRPSPTSRIPASGSAAAIRSAPCSPTGADAETLPPALVDGGGGDLPRGRAARARGAA